YRSQNTESPKSLPTDRHDDDIGVEGEHTTSQKVVLHDAVAGDAEVQNFRLRDRLLKSGREELGGACPDAPHEFVAQHGNATPASGLLEGNFQPAQAPLVD